MVECERGEGLDGHARVGVLGEEGVVDWGWAAEAEFYVSHLLGWGLRSKV